MKKEQAISLSNLIDTFASSTTFDVTKLETLNGKLHNFHQWSNGKPLISGYRVFKLGEYSHFLLLIDWHRNDNYYLVIYTENKSTTLAEIQKIVDHNGFQQLEWKYNPLKRDGLNAQRKAYFQKVFGSTTVHIPLPRTCFEVDTFFNQLFTLCSNRLRSDNILKGISFYE